MILKKRVETLSLVRYNYVQVVKHVNAK